MRAQLRCRRKARREKKRYRAGGLSRWRAKCCGNAARCSTLAREQPSAAAARPSARARADATRKLDALLMPTTVRRRARPRSAPSSAFCLDSNARARERWKTNR